MMSELRCPNCNLLDESIYRNKGIQWVLNKIDNIIDDLQKMAVNYESEEYIGFHFAMECFKRKILLLKQGISDE